MSVSDFLIAGIASDFREHSNAHFFEQRRHAPHLTCDVVFANQVDVKRGGVFWFARADHVLQQRLTADAVTEVLAANKARGTDGNDGDVEFLAGGFAHRFQIIPDQRRDTGEVDKHGSGVVAFFNFSHRLVELLFATKDDVVLAQISGEAYFVDHRARR